MAFHSFTTCSKAPFGFHIRCSDKLQAITARATILDTNIYLKGGAKVPNLAQAASFESFWSP